MPVNSSLSGTLSTTLTHPAAASAEAYRSQFLAQNPAYLTQVKIDAGMHDLKLPEGSDTFAKLEDYLLAIETSDSLTSKVSRSFYTAGANLAYRGMLPAITTGIGGIIEYYNIPGNPWGLDCFGLSMGLAAGVGAELGRWCSNWTLWKTLGQNDADTYSGFLKKWEQIEQSKSKPSDNDSCLVFVGYCSMLVGAAVGVISGPLITWGIAGGFSSDHFSLPLAALTLGVAATVAYGGSVAKPFIETFKHLRDHFNTASQKSAVEKLLAAKDNPLHQESFWSANLNEQLNLIDGYVTQSLEKDIENAGKEIGERAKLIADYREKLKNIQKSDKLSPEKMKLYEKEMTALIAEIESQKTIWENDILGKFNRAKTLAGHVMNKIRIELGQSVALDKSEDSHFEELVFQELEREKAKLLKSGRETFFQAKRAREIVQSLEAFFNDVAAGEKTRRELMDYGIADLELETVREKEKVRS